MNQDKIDFANFMYNKVDAGLFANACERYGMTWGCDTDCPVLQAHKCELKYTDNRHIYKDYLQELAANGEDVSVHLL